MAITLRPRSGTDPLHMDEDEYDALVKRTEGGWSQCADEREWLAKLHYLRGGLESGKLSREDFLSREAKLVGDWLRKLI